MLFLGPTGVGKTETCLLLARHLFGGENKLVRLDMSECQEQRSIGVLLGANLGERGLLGHYYDLALRSGILLLDEIEKAHPLILDLLLQMLSAARVRLASGESWICGGLLSLQLPTWDHEFSWKVGRQTAKHWFVEHHGPRWTS